MPSSTRLRIVLALVAVCCGAWTGEARPQEAASADAATRQYAAAAALHNREQFSLAADEWARFLRDFSDDTRAVQTRFYLSVCRFKLEQFDAARRELEKVVAGGEKFEQLETAWLFLGLAQYNLARQNQPELFAAAEKSFRTLRERFSRGRHAAEALFYLGEALYSDGRAAEAIAAYQQFVKTYPRDALLADALYALGVAQEEEGQTAQAGAAYESFLRQFDKHPLATEVSMRRGETLLAAGKVDAAERLFAAAAATADFALADHALMRQAACAYEKREYAQAAALYHEVTQRFPRSGYLAAARLAAGRSAYLAGNHRAAREHLDPLISADDPLALEAVHWTARSLLKEQRPAEALKLVEQRSARAGQTPVAAQLLLDRADALYDLPDRRRESIAVYADLAERFADDPQAPHALYMAALASLGEQDYQAALDFAGRFRQRYAGDALSSDVISIAAESHLQRKEHDAAEQHFRELTERYSRDPAAGGWTIRRALNLSLARRWADVIKTLEPALPGLGDRRLAAEGWFLVGTAQNELKQYASAARALEASIKADATWQQADEVVLALALAQRQQNDLDAARLTLERLIKVFPDSHLLDRAHYRLGEYLFAAGDYSASAGHYDEVLRRWPDSPLASHSAYGLAWSQLNRGQPEEALATLDRLLAAAPEKALAARGRYARALARHQLKQYKPAIDDLNAYLKTGPGGSERSDALYVLGLCQAGEGRATEAAATFRRLLADDAEYPNADKVLYELGWALKSAGDEGEAAEAFQRLARQHPGSPLTAESLFHVAERAYEKEDFARAAATYYEAMNKAGKTDLGEKAVHKLGWAYFRQEAFAKARDTFSFQRTRFADGPLAGDAAFMEAESLFKQGQYREALTAYGQVKNTTGQDFDVLALLHAGQAAGRLGQWEASLKWLDTAAAKFPQSSYLPEIHYEQALARQKLGRTDEALELYESVTAQTDREVAARARFMIGEIHFEKKDHAEAIRNFFKVAYGYGYAEWQAAAHFEAGRCFEVLGKTEQARKSYQEIVDKYPKSDRAQDARARLAALK